MTRSAEARQVFESRWRELRRAAEGESGLRLRRSGWTLLVLAFCGGLAIAGRLSEGRRRAARSEGSSSG